MIDKTKINFKKGVACLLAALQVGIVAGCSSKSYKEEYNEAVATIEKLESEKESLQDELNKGSIYEDKYNEALAKIEQLEGENKALQDKLNQKDGIIFNQELANTIGLNEDILQIDEVKKYVDEFNTYLSGYNNVSCQIENKDGAKFLNFICDGEIIGEVYTSFETSRLVRFRYQKNECDYYCSFVIDEENKKMYSFNDELSWPYEGDVFCIGGRTDNYKSTVENPYSTYLDFNLLNDNADKDKLVIYISRNEDNTYTLDLNSKSVIYAPAGEYVSFNINKEDFENLDNLITSYKENGHRENALAYVGNTVLDVIQKYGKEKECQKYIDVIKNNTPSNNKEDNNLDNELATKLGIDESILANSDIQKVLKKLNDYLNKQPNIKDDNFADTHQIYFYSDGSLKGRIHFSDTTRCFVVTLYYEDYFESITVSLYENLNTNYISGDKTWNFENNIYYLSATNHTDGKNDYKEIGKDTEDSTLSIVLVDSDTPHINIQKFIFADNQMIDRGLWSYNINIEDYQTLNNLIDSYKNSNEFGDIVDYIKDALLNSLEKELSEEKYVEIKNVLENEKVLVFGK